MLRLLVVTLYALVSAAPCSSTAQAMVFCLVRFESSDRTAPEEHVLLLISLFPLHLLLGTGDTE
jgi:hypothetical protein